jgi:hypothetical protein
LTTSNSPKVLKTIFKYVFNRKLIANRSITPKKPSLEKEICWVEKGKDVRWKKFTTYLKNKNKNYLK